MSETTETTTITTEVPKPDQPNVEMVPVHTVILSRPTGDIDPGTKKPVHERIVPPIGKPFMFTQKEVAQSRKHAPGALRSPHNESADAPEEADQAVAAAAAAYARGHAARDALVTAAEVTRGAKKGRNRQAGKGSGTGNAEDVSTEVTEDGQDTGKSVDQDDDEL